MKLLFLHGPPASGKFTIAEGLAERFGIINFHNHLTLDVARALFDFGTPEFWALTHRLRREALGAKASDPDATVTFTNCYSRPHDDATVAALEETVLGKGGEFVPVYLECGPAELRRRVVADGRASMRKLHTVGGLEEFLGHWNCVPLDRPNCITVATEGRTPADCVAEIGRRLGLAGPPAD